MHFNLLYENLYSYTKEEIDNDNYTIPKKAIVKVLAINGDKITIKFNNRIFIVESYLLSNPFSENLLPKYQIYTLIEHSNYESMYFIYKNRVLTSKSVILPRLNIKSFTLGIDDDLSYYVVLSKNENLDCQIEFDATNQVSIRLTEEIINIIHSNSFKNYIVDNSVSCKFAQFKIVPEYEDIFWIPVHKKIYNES